MIKTIKNIDKQEHQRYKVPKTVQDLIPIQTVYDDGIFQVMPNMFSKTFRFEDINYAVASGEDKASMFLKYSEILNSLDSGATTKITINNRRMDKREIARDILIPSRKDRLDPYRMKYNKILLKKTTGTTAMVQDKYLTISVYKQSAEDARSYFARVGAELGQHFSRLGSRLIEISGEERLKILFNFYRIGEESEFNFDVRGWARRGRSFKDDIITELTDISRNLMLSIDVVPIPADEAVRQVENLMFGVKTNAANWQRRQNANNNFSAMLPYDLELQRKETKEFLEDLTTRDQRMMFAVLTLVRMADTKKQLDDDTEAIMTAARKKLCQLSILKWQQMDGLNTALPVGVRKIKVMRTLTTESLVLV